MTKLKNLMTDNYYFFVGGVFSQWYPSKFKDDHGVEFCTAEQYMMYRKAKLFADHEIAQKILETNDPTKQKELGRQVQDFDPEIWNEYAQEIVFRGNFLKFTQNSELYAFMKEMGDRTFVEAADYDPVWGIKLGAYDPAILDEAKWQGTNWLGEALMRVRDLLEKQNFLPNAIMSDVLQADFEADKALFARAEDQSLTVTTIKGIVDHLNKDVSIENKITNAEYLDEMRLVSSGTQNMKYGEVYCPTWHKKIVKNSDTQFYNLNRKFFEYQSLNKNNLKNSNVKNFKL